MHPNLSRQGMRAFALAAAIAAGVAGTKVLWADNTANPSTSAAPLRSQSALPQFGDIYEQVAPSVVSVRTTRDVPNETPLPSAPSQGMGSGFIISSDGYILTNAHVVNGATEVIVVLKDDREFKAKVIGSDRRTDVALIKIESDQLPAAKIGDPARTRVGDWVAALGSPFGFTQTLTAGIVSAKSRALPNEAYVPFIQTDAALNPGNSGGPLLNTQGEVIGVNSQIYSPTGGYAGLSFAIPIDVAVKIKDQLQLHGKVTRGRLGVAIQDISKELAESFGLSSTKGALVTGVEKNGPAAAAGVRNGDVVTAVNGKATEKAAEVSRAIGELKPGEKVTVTLMREGSPRSIDVKLDELPGDKVALAQDKESPPKLGVVVRPTTAQEQERIGEAGGVVVEQVTGAAAKAGIRQGDVILALNHTQVAGVEDLKRLVDAAGKRAAVLLDRNGARIYVPVILG